MDVEKPKIFETLTKTENANIDYAKSVYPNRILLYQEGCNLLGDVIKEIASSFTNRKEAEDKDVAVIALCNRILGTSKVVYELSIRGYQFDTMILVRSLYENFLVLNYVQRSASNTQKWLEAKVRLPTIVKELSLSSDKELRDFYFSISDYAHVNFEAIITLMKPQDKNHTINISIEPRGLADKQNFLPNFWANVLEFLSKHYKQLIKTETLTKISKLVKEADSLSELFR
jgi:hypothetical protein